MPKKLLSKYEHFLALTDNMLVLAKANEWEKFADAETEYLRLSESLPNIVDIIEKHPEIRDRFVDMCQKITSNIGELTLLTQNYQTSVSQNLTNLSCQKKVHLAYTEFSNQAIESRMFKDSFR
ncbi:flagellar protein FliT [Thorsellia anophelis]|uniref:Flagellar protein FliT n=1 Tax=Thorsellia anophelis DSM 18579 TaxID=1123402 RepID=A0A1H9ZGS8_9GAMM|nr:flagellar protein FliT [Thorsellia anophelis]SES80036.1 protein FliT [Thorsellia anophelis DSM 18579]